MEESNSFLSHFITEDIYNIQEDVMVSTPTVEEPTPAPLQKKVKVLVVVSDEEKVAHWDMLTNLLKALKLSPSDYDIQSRHLETLLPETVIYFGSGPTALHQVDKEFAFSRISTVLPSTLQQDTDKKRQLWNCLKTYFQI